MRCSVCGNILKIKNGMYVCTNCNFTKPMPTDGNIDVFICCTELTPQGTPTTDSKMSQDLYNRLIERNINVFYPAKSLAAYSRREQKTIMEKAVENAKIIVITISDKSNLENVLRYYGSAFKNKAVLPVYSSMSEDEIQHIPEMFPPINFHTPGAVDKVCNDIFNILNLLESRGKKPTTLSRKKKKKTIALFAVGFIIFVVIAMITVFVLFTAPKLSDEKDYNEAQSLAEDGMYSAALNIYNDLGNYKDSVDLKCKLYSEYNGFYSNRDKMVELDLSITNGTAKIQINEYYGNKLITTQTKGTPVGSTINFKYTDSANVSGTGTIELYDDGIGLTIKSQASDAYCISTGTVIFPLESVSES